MGHKNLLKTVLIKSAAATMAQRCLESQAIYVCGLAHEYCRTNHDYDLNQMNLFLTTLHEIGGDESGSISISFADNAHIRYHLESALLNLMDTLEIERPATFARLSDMNWRLLFGIAPEPPVKIEVVNASDEDSGGSEATGSSTSINQHQVMP